jgi:hypothetical protein
MARHLLTYRCLIISPSDVETERDAVEEGIRWWNAHGGAGLDVRVEPVRWESHARPELGGTAQGQINKQLVDDCDFGVAVFWSRLGNPTAEHPSGSVEEIERLLAADRRVMAYFCSRPVPQERLRDDQFARLTKAKESFEQRGLLASFDTVDSLKTMVGLHLSGLVSSLTLQQRAAGQPIPAMGVVTAPTPDIRVSVRTAFAARGGGDTIAVLSVSVQNHSPTDFFMSSLTFTLEDTSTVFVQRDALSGEYLTGRKIEPGNAFEFHVDPSVIEEGAKRSLSDLRDVLVTDRIQRSYRSKPGQLQTEVASWRQTKDVLRKHRR